MSGGNTLPAVEFRAVTKRYGNVTAVQTVSFSIARGTLVTLLGPSGCGKTTILRLIAGLEQASEGQILIEGVDVTLLSAAERDVSMVFQSYALFPHMTVLENVCYGLRASGMRRVQAVELAQAKRSTSCSGACRSPLSTSRMTNWRHWRSPIVLW
jgi:iron(III) transport system ATP-binding protein